MHKPTRLIEVLSAWNACHGAFYRASEIDLNWNLSEQKLIRYWREDFAGVPVMLAEATPEGARMGVLDKGIWVSLYGDTAGREIAFATAAEDFARSHGKTRLAIGSDEFHFLPGAPLEDATLTDIFKARGFTAADCADYVGTVDSEKCTAYIREAAQEALKRGWMLHGLRDARDRDDLTAFLLKEFKGRWSREWEVWQQRNDSARGFWNLLRDEHGKVLGFSRLAIRGRYPETEKGWTPGAMRLPLGTKHGRENTDSCLGPIGISKEERGRGAGKILLGLSLHEFSLQGAKLTCIDWTNAYNYYTPLGFEIVRRYLTLWKELLL
jgi:hypothetical protein